MTEAIDLDKRYSDLKQEVAALEARLASFEKPSLGADFLVSMQGTDTLDSQALETFNSLLRTATEKRVAWLQENQGALRTVGDYAALEPLVADFFIQEGTSLRALADGLDTLFGKTNAAYLELKGDRRTTSGKIEEYKSTQRRLEFARRNLEEFEQSMELVPPSLDAQWNYTLIAPSGIFSPVTGVRGNYDQYARKVEKAIRGCFSLGTPHFLSVGAIDHDCEDWTDITGYKFQLGFLDADVFNNPIFEVEDCGSYTRLSMDINPGELPLSESISSLMGIVIDLSRRSSIPPEGYLRVCTETERPVADYQTFRELQKALVPFGWEVVSYDLVPHSDYHAFKIQFKPE
jgi:hypothetical protein